MTALPVALAVLAIVAVAAVSARPRVPGGTPPPDVPAAKAAGDALLASVETTVLVFTAHPDDAEWWIGGTLGMLAKRNKVVLVLGTSGEKGNAGLQPDLGAVREALQREGAEVLGYSEVIFLRHPDGGLADAVEYPAEVARLIDRYEPATVITFDTEREGAVYHHVDHEAAGRTALRAARAHGGITAYLFHTSAPDVICDFGPVRERKSQALSILASYHDTSPLGWLSRLGRFLGLERAAISFGGRSRFPEVGVEYGELFRRVEIPRR